MKKAKKIIIIIVSLLLIVGVGCFIYFNYLYDSNKLNIKEKEWINNNANKVVSFGIPANINNFSKNGSGVFYDFTSDLESEYKLNINDNTYNTFDNSLGFYITNKESANDLLFYKDFYVLVSKDDKVITNINNTNINTNKIINVLVIPISFIKFSIVYIPPLVKYSILSLYILYIYLILLCLIIPLFFLDHHLMYILLLFFHVFFLDLI